MCLNFFFQLDANELDLEVLGILKNQLSVLISHLPVSILKA